MKKTIYLLFFFCSNLYASDSLNLVCTGQQKITIVHPSFSESTTQETKTILVTNRRWNTLSCHEWTDASILCTTIPKEYYKDRNYLLNADNYRTLRIDRFAGTVSLVNLSKSPSSTIYVTFDGNCKKSTKPKF